MTGPWGMPGNASLQGAALDRQMVLNLWIFAGLFALAHVLGGFALVLGRVRGRVPQQPLTHRRWRWELLPVLGAAVLFFGLAWKSARLWAEQRYSGADAAALQVEAVGMQFAWYFRYPGPDGAFGATKAELVEPGAGNPVGIDPADERGRDDYVRSALVLPAGREVDVRLRALDVIHGFAVPALRVKQNALPGQTFHIHFTPMVPGEYAVLCTQVCGLGHYRMQAVVKVVPAAEYAVWVRAQQDMQVPAGVHVPVRAGVQTQMSGEAGQSVSFPNGEVRR